MRRFFIAAFAVITLPAAFAASPFDGKWIVHVDGLNRSSTDVVLADGKGTFTTYASGVIAKNDPCMNKQLPAIVKAASDTEVTIDVDGNSVLKGCLSASLVLHPAADGAWTGALPEGTVMTWRRK